jgi:hypothetical protein
MWQPVIYGDPLFLDVMGKCEETVVFRGSKEIEIVKSFISVTRVLWLAGGKQMWENDHKTLKITVFMAHELHTCCDIRKAEVEGQWLVRPF